MIDRHEENVLNGLMKEVKHCLRCSCEDCYEANIDENGFCEHCICDFINEAREFCKQMSFLDVTDVNILMAEFAAFKVSESRKKRHLF